MGSSAEVLAQIPDHLGEPGFVGVGAGLAGAVGFSLMPQYAFEDAGGGGQSGAGEGLFVEIGALGPASERTAADGAGHEADGDRRVGFEHFSSEGQARTDARLGAADLRMERVAGENPSTLWVERKKPGILRLPVGDRGAAAGHV